MGEVEEDKGGTKHEDGEQGKTQDDQNEESEEFFVEPIEECEVQQYKSVVERYYTPKYCLDVTRPADDYCILIHSNRVCAVTLAPSHYLYHEKISAVNFKVKEGLDRSSNHVSGKWKHGAQRLQPSSALLVVKTEGDKSYPVVAAITGKLLEVNIELMTNPSLMVEEPQGRGYLALVLPDIPVSDRYREELPDESEYRLRVERRQREGQHLSDTT